MACFDSTRGALRGTHLSRRPASLLHRGGVFLETIPLHAVAAIRIAFVRSARQLAWGGALVLIALILIAVSAPLAALANPTGGQVVGGQATIQNPNANNTIINQASEHAIINWQQFSIGSDQYVQFIQPDSAAVILNRVIGGDPSSILGTMKANGQVFLVNPNGIFFGQGASLDVQGLVASTLDIKNSDFMAGNYVFSKNTNGSDASVTNLGTITAHPNGYIVLAGDYAENDGIIWLHRVMQVKQGDCSSSFFRRIVPRPTRRSVCRHS